MLAGNANEPDAAGEGEEEEEIDPTVLILQAEHVVEALDKFERVREKKAFEELMGQSKAKKKTAPKVEDEETRKSREALK